jgi:GNAT superfamily N-acetyltransferase
MIRLAPVDFLKIQHWFVDYQKKSKNYEMPPEEAEILGIYKAEELIGYFIVVCYKSGLVEINQGYLKPDARHKLYSRVAMELLEKLVKDKGFNRIQLATNRAVGSYQRFMRNLGFSLVRAEFAKELKEV